MHLYYLKLVLSGAIEETITLYFSYKYKSNIRTLLHSKDSVSYKQQWIEPNILNLLKNFKSTM